MIKLTDISFSYGTKKILDNFNLTVNDGQCVCLVGPSGCGKTTIVRLILGLEKQDSGTIEVPKSISCVFQEDRLIDSLTLKKNVTLPLKKSQYDFAEKLIVEAGLAEAENKKPSELSGGMKRRTAIIRAIAFGQDALILDEPFNGIDSIAKKKIAEIILREYIEKGKTVLLISHNHEDYELLGAQTVLI